MRNKMILTGMAVVVSGLLVATGAVGAEGTAPTLDDLVQRVETLESGGAVKFGGALRTNYAYRDWNESERDRTGDFGIELFRLNVAGAVQDFTINAEYRFYPQYEQHMIHHGYVGYAFTDELEGQLGVHQVPFGIQPYASHNFWFSGAYYLGLEDDYDAGAKLLYKKGNLDAALAFYKNEELGNPSASAPRYSVDVLTGNGYDSRESNQINGRVAYTINHDDTCSLELGLSGQYGQLYDTTTKDNGSHTAAAIHAVGNHGNLNIQLEGAWYNYDPEYAAGVNDKIVQVGAFGGAYEIPAEAMVGIVNVAYTIPVDKKMLDSVTVYSDNTIIEPDESQFRTGWLNVVGALLSSGPVYTYVDLISAENMPFLDGSLVAAEDSGRKTRININVGYYF